MGSYKNGNLLLVMLAILLFQACENNTTSFEKSLANEELINEELKIEEPQMNNSTTSPSCVGKTFETILISYDQSDLMNGFTSDVVCPPSFGGDGYLSVSSFSKPIETSDGYEIIVEKWNNNTSTWDYYWYTVFYREDIVYFRTNDTADGPFANLNGNELFRFRVFAILFTSTGGGNNVNGVDSLKVRFDLSD